jgi:hypothetical protein
MCPACLTAAAMLAAEAVSVGGVAVLAAKALHRTLRAKPVDPTPELEGEKYEPTADRIAG